MEDSKILSHVDHTLLRPSATWEEIKQLCLEAIQYGMASVCIPPCYVDAVRKEFEDKELSDNNLNYIVSDMPTAVGIPETKSSTNYLTIPKIVICTVIGFPLGYATTAVKIAELKEAKKDGATEFDMVINLCDVKNGNYNKITEEISALKQVAEEKIVKVIIETCYLTEDEKISLCGCVTKAGADFIKTSTGFGTAGATLSDILLFKNHIGNDVKIKAAGGIRTKEDMCTFLDAGCERLGTSSAIQLITGRKPSGY